MKLIVSYLKSLSTYVTREFYYIMSDLISTYGWKHIETNRLWSGPGTIRDKLLREFGEVPATILFWEGYEFLSSRANEVHLLDCHKSILTDDLHWWSDQMRVRKLVSMAACDMILSTYGYAWDKFYPELCVVKKVVWVPHSASPDFLIKYNNHPENSIFLSGAMTHHYPMRQQIKRLQAEGSYSIIYHGHPGYYCGYNYNHNDNIGCGYAARINKYRAAFTDSLIYKYTVAKYFEIPATGALLFADDAVSGPLRKLGFIENEHYLAVSKDNLEARIQYVLDESNHDELDAIRRRGQELVWERHKTSDRASQIDEACSNESIRRAKRA
jgi:hypothetical protein